MKNLHPLYRPISQWKVLETYACHDFTEFAATIEAVKVEIGTLYADHININNTLTSVTTPIIRWLTRKQFDYLNKNEGMIIW